jgi:hypothetical protein
MSSPRPTFILLAAALLLVPLAGTAAAGPAHGHVAAAADLTRAGQTDDAARLLAARVALAPDDLAAQLHLMPLLDRMVLNADAEGLEGVRQVLPGWPPVLQRLGALYDGRRMHAEAEAAYLAWEKARPGNPEPAARLGEHYALTGNTGRAIAWLSRHRALVGESDYADRRIADLSGIGGGAGRLASGPGEAATVR